MSHLRIALAALVVIALLFVAPAAFGKTLAEERAECQKLEAEWGPTATAYCWEAVRETEADEASEARTEAAIRESEEREAAKKAEHQAQKEAREKQAQEREEERIRIALRRRPTVRRHLAEEQIAVTLHESRRWRTKMWGYVSCDGGRRNRTTWKCGVFFRGRSGSYWCGEARVEGAWFNPNEGERPWYRTKWSARRC